VGLDDGFDFLHDGFLKAKSAKRGKPKRMMDDERSFTGVRKKTRSAAAKEAARARSTVNNVIVGHAGEPLRHGGAMTVDFLTKNSKCLTYLN
jgi:hypothetical protein